MCLSIFRAFEKLCACLCQLSNRHLITLLLLGWERENRKRMIKLWGQKKDREIICYLPASVSKTDWRKINLLLINTNI